MSFLSKKGALTAMMAFLLGVPAACAGRCGKSGGGGGVEPGNAWKRPRLVDAHTHLNAFAMWTIRGIMDENGVEYMVNLSGGNQAEPGEFQLSLLMWKISGGRILNCYNPDWTRIDEPDFGKVEADRLAAAVADGFVCLKFSKALGLQVRRKSGSMVGVDDPVLEALWQAAGRLGIPVFIHTADPKAFFKPLDEKNERYKELMLHPAWSFYGKGLPDFDALLDAFERVVKGHPGTTFIGVHLGNDAEDPDRVGRMLDSYANYYIDVAARVPEFGRHPAEKMKAFFVKHQDRILFGSDIGIMPGRLVLGSEGEDRPAAEDARRFYLAHFRYFETDDRRIEHPTPIQGDWKVDAIGLPPPVLEKLYRGNAMRVLRIGANQTGK